MNIITLIPVTYAIKKMIVDSLIQDVYILINDLIALEGEEYVDICLNDVDCRLSIFRISYDTVYIILEETFKEALKDAWNAVLEAYREEKEGFGSVYHT